MVFIRDKVNMCQTFCRAIIHLFLQERLKIYSELMKIHRI